MRVAVLGAGFQGACVALELARRGVHVDLFDKNDRPITQAGAFNEGKIHLGFLYANDPTKRTAKMMVRGALSFRRLLGRWIDLDADPIRVSTAFDYAVHRNSMLEVERIIAHFEWLRSYIQATSKREGADYLGLSFDSVFEPLSQAEMAQRFDGKIIVAAFKTIERSVDPGEIAERLRVALADSTAIDFHPNHCVTGARLEDAGVSVQFTSQGTEQSTAFDHVVNSLWDGRLAVDRRIGLPTTRPVLYRFKYGIRLRADDGGEDVPSTTVVLGRFGDIVRFDNGDLYLSWYPVCIWGMSSEPSPDWPRELEEAKSQSLFEESLAALRTICPALSRLEGTNMRKVTIRGGVIVAWGQTDIEGELILVENWNGSRPCGLMRLQRPTSPHEREEPR